jgi:alpha-mannosidase
VFCGRLTVAFPHAPPGKAIDDTLEMYEKQLAILRPLIAEALDIVTPAIPATNGQTAATETPDILGIDPVRLGRSEVVALNSNLGASAGSGFGYLQTGDDGSDRVVDVSNKATPPKAYQNGDEFIVENAHFRLTISSGRITSLYDVVYDRELILAGSSAETGGLMTYDDFPLAYDAWDAEIYHLDCSHLIEFTEVKVGMQESLRASLVATAKFGKSTVEMTVGRGAKYRNKRDVRADRV